MRQLSADLLIDAHAQLGEGPVWDDRTQTLWWVDIEPGHLHHYDPSSEQDEVFELRQRIGAIALRREGPLLVATESGIGDFDVATGHFVAIVDPEERVVNNRFNDAKCDPAGRFWAGTMALDFEEGAGALYRLEEDFKIAQVLSGVSISNGLAWTQDRQTLYYVDSVPRTVTAFDFDQESGRLSNPRVVIDVPAEMGSPDGMTIDDQDHLWIAHYGGSKVRCFDPSSGEVLVEISVPASQVTSCTFGGPDLATLFITTAAQGLDRRQLAREPHAGGVFYANVAELGVQGLPADRFGERRPLSSFS